GAIAQVPVATRTNPGNLRATAYGPARLIRSAGAALPYRGYVKRRVRSAVFCITCSMVHCRGDLSGRHRKNLVPWRKRRPVKWSYRTSTTSSGFKGCHCADRPVDHRLGPPGALPVNPGGAMSFLSLIVIAFFSSRGIVEVKPT